MQHLDEGTIHAWLDGGLPPAERDAVADHVAHCPECAAAVADARGMIAGASRILSTLDTVPGGVLPRAAESHRRRSMWRALHLTPARAALAASLMVAAAGALAVRHQSAARSYAPESTPAAAAPAAAPVAAAPSPAPPPQQSTATDAPAVHKAVVAEPSFASGNARRKRPDSTAESAAPAPASTPALAPPTAAPERATTAVAKAGLDSLTKITTTSSAGANAAVTAAAASPRAISADRVVGRQRSSRALPSPFAVDGVQPGFTGCYEISNGSASGALHVPMRFALQRAAPLARGGQMRLVAVALTADGHVDTLAAQGTWRAVDDNTAAVSWMSDGAPSMVTIHFTSPQLSAEVETDGRKTSLNVTRVECRP